MSIATMEALTGLSNGTSLTVGTDQRIFTVDSGHLVYDGFKVPMDQFIHEVSSGVVREGVPFQLRQWWRHRSGYRMYVVALESDSSAVIAEFRREGQWRQLRRRVTSQDRMTLMTEPPPWASEGVNRAEHEWAHAHRIDALTQTAEAERERRIRDNTSLTEQHDTFKTNLSEALCAYIEAQGIEANAGLFRIMRDHGLQTPKRIVKVKVTAVGTTMARLTPEAAALLVPEGAEVAEEQRYTDARVNWTKDFEVEREVDAGACACRTISRSTVRGLVQDAGITDWWDLSHRVSCENCA